MHKKQISLLPAIGGVQHYQKATLLEIATFAEKDQNSFGKCWKDLGNTWNIVEGKLNWYSKKIIEA